VAAPGRVDWSPRALRDLIAIYRNTAADNPRAAAEQGEHIIERAEALARQPRMGKASHWRGRRVLVLTPYPYSIYYRCFRRSVRVVRVVHQRRRFP
jgi:plasmid stabilization system protein ParE